ncbi:hypothetical protein KR009_008110, partial [Drosophila setifemur]
TSSVPHLEPGVDVLIHEDNAPPLQWLSGVVVREIPGEDGKVPVAEVRTKNGIFKRAINRLDPPPLN